MKVYFEKNQTSYPKGGKKEGIIFCYFRHSDLCLGRKYIPIPFLPQNLKIISMEKLTLQIWHNLPLRFKHDLSSYARQYKLEYPDLRRKHLNSYGIFLKVIHKLDKQYLFSKRDDASYNLYVLLFGHLSVADFIKSGVLLPIHKGYKLTARIIFQTKASPYIPASTLTEDLSVFSWPLAKPG